MQKANGWNALFWCNHDQPRAVSRFGDNKRYWKESAKMLATCIHLMRGTPYIFQGEELGITNAGYACIGQYRDVESLNYYQIMLQSGKTEEEALKIPRQRSRDNGRTPMQWDASPNAGFSSGTPWITLPDNFKTINAEAEKQDEDSILHYYKELIRLRKDNPIISDGRIEFLNCGSECVFAYQHTLGQDQVVVLNNFSDRDMKLCDIPWSATCKKVIGNYPDVHVQDGCLTLRPYESVAFRK